MGTEQATYTFTCAGCGTTHESESRWEPNDWQTIPNLDEVYCPACKSRQLHLLYVYALGRLETFQDDDNDYEDVHLLDLFPAGDGFIKLDKGRLSQAALAVFFEETRFWTNVLYKITIALGVAVGDEPSIAALARYRELVATARKAEGSTTA